MIRNTSAAQTPWHVVPADRKWFTQLVVEATIMNHHPARPQISGVGREALKQMEAVRKALLADFLQRQVSAITVPLEIRAPSVLA